MPQRNQVSVKFERVEGFDNDTDGTQLKKLRDFCRQDFGRHEDDWNIRQQNALAHVLQRGGTVKARHHDVHQHEVRPQFVG